MEIDCTYTEFGKCIVCNTFQPYSNLQLAYPHLIHKQRIGFSRICKICKNNWNVNNIPSRE